MEGIRKITIKDKEYPKPLKEISGAPSVLYVKGVVLPVENCFAIVGTRRCSYYGKEIALEIASNLAEAGLTIVSGLAPGIDTFVHQAVIERDRRTIAVLGTGLDEKSIYPRSNLNLAQKIFKTGGALISEYPPEEGGSKFTFPKRNRIISGLSLGVLVIEAKRKSGALITADWARKQGRKIFAVPGSIQSLNSRGCHFLIKKGAKLVESADDVLEELNLSRAKKVKTELKGKTPEEQLILDALKEGGLETDKIIEKTNLSTQKVAALLAILEIQGKVRNLEGNIYALMRQNQ